MRGIQTLVIASLLLAPAAAPAQERADSAAFIVRLGRDTTSIERVVSTRTTHVAEAVQRSPSTILHRMVMDLTPRGEVSRSVYTVTRPGSAEPFFSRTITIAGDSATVANVQGANTRTKRVAVRNAIPIAGPFYSPYEMAMMRAAAGRQPRATVQLLQPDTTVDIPLERVGADSMALTNQFQERMRARVDARGRLLDLHTPAFTTVERVAWLDLEPWVREFTARDASGRGMGPLSPRQTSRAFVGGANLWLDYSRPFMRGRPIWGALVPYGAVWRMGANDAAHFATDRRVQLGGLALEPGTYTLFLLPTADAWTLVVNRKTGMSGLEHDPSADVGRVAMTRETLERPAEQFTLELRPAATGATLYVAWDRQAATVPIRVAP
ncbi:MAG TPA: DUF2911 domain-containing protein [Longimicrobium sp.]|nr:DUF2911 domain-containing protein [Longimicrobium sp.]